MAGKLGIGLLLAGLGVGLAVSSNSAMAQQQGAGGVQYPKATTIPLDGAKPQGAGKTAKAAANPCKGLDSWACAANSACAWVVPKEASSAAAKVEGHYCQKAGSTAAVSKPVAKPAVAAMPKHATTTRPKEAALPSAAPAGGNEAANPTETSSIAQEPEQPASGSAISAQAAAAAAAAAAAHPSTSAPPQVRKTVPTAPGLFVVQ